MTGFSSLGSKEKLKGRKRTFGGGTAITERNGRKGKTKAFRTGEGRGGSGRKTSTLEKVQNDLLQKQRALEKEKARLDHEKKIALDKKLREETCSKRGKAATAAD